VDSSALGMGILPGNTVNSFGEVPDKENFGLNITRIRKYLDKIKPGIVKQLNNYLETQTYGFM